MYLQYLWKEVINGVHSGVHQVQNFYDFWWKPDMFKLPKKEVC